MNRRALLGLLGGAAASWPVVARAQETAPLIGVFMPYPESDAEAKLRVGAFRDELGRLGWTVDKAKIEEHWAGTDVENIRRSAANLVQQRPNVILANTPRALAPLLDTTHDIPVVFVGVSDPVATWVRRKSCSPR